MKKFLVSFGIFLGLMVSSCSNNEDSSPNDNKSQVLSDNNVEQPLVVQHLIEVNDSVRETLMNKYGANSSSRILGFLKWFKARLDADVAGAYNGAKEGGERGKEIGERYGIPEIGEFGGMVIGGAINGFLASIGIHKKQTGCAIIGIPSFEMTKTAYCRVRDEMSDEDGNSDCVVAKLDYLDFPMGYESIEDVGRIHNKLMNRFMDNSNEGDVMPLGLIVETPVIDDVMSLSPIEMSILDSEELEQSYNDLINDIYTDNFIIGTGKYEIGAILEDVMSLYDQVIEQILEHGGFSDVISITNQYIAVVAESDEISDEDKEVLYIAFAVAVYSYEYWSNYDFEE